jgi:hypothetical protein
MEPQLVDITMHIDQRIQAPQLEDLRDRLLSTNGVMSADYQSNRPHLMIIGYDPGKIDSMEVLRVAEQKGIHAELIGM